MKKTTPGFNLLCQTYPHDSRDKFRELEQRAMAHLTRPLDAPELVDMNRASVIVLIWRYPAFEPYQSWRISTLSCLSVCLCF